MIYAFKNTVICVFKQFLLLSWYVIYLVIVTLNKYQL